MKILLIKEGKVESASLEWIFGQAGFETQACNGVRECPELANEDCFDLFVVGASDASSGTAACIELRRSGIALPVLVVLDANSTFNERITALDSGADDCLSAPFEPAELVARSRALIRRRTNPQHYRLQLGPLVLDRSSRRVVVDDEAAALTERESHLLAYLIRRAGTTVSRSEIIEHVWSASAVESNVVEVHIRRLRCKLGAKSNWIETIRGAGYRLRKQEAHLPVELAPIRKVTVSDTGAPLVDCVAE